MNQEFSGSQKMTETSMTATDGGNNYETSIRSRGVKISSAIHMVTELVSDGEPIRHELRRSAIDLVSLLTEGRDRFYGESAELFRMTKQVTQKIEAFLEIASSARIISPMNGDILRAELNRFRKDLEDEQNANAERRLFPLEMLLGSNQIRLADGEKKEQVAEKQDDTIGQKEGQMTQLARAKEKTTEHKKSYSTQGHTETKGEKKSRRDLIINAVRKNGEVSLSDMKTVVNGVSDKTLQRELGALVEDGVLKRSGDRRWTKYSIRGPIS